MKLFSLSPLSLTSLRGTCVFYACAVAGCLLLFPPLIDITGTSTIALSVVPVAAAGWLMGVSHGILAASLLTALDIFLFRGIRWSEALTFVHQWPRVAAIFAIGSFTGWAAGMIRTAGERERELAREREALETEITRRVAAEEKLSENLRFLEVVMNAIPNPVFYKDGDGRYLGCNDAFCSFLGMPPESIVGKTVYDVAPRLFADIYRDRDSELFASPGVQTYESTVVRHDGMRRDVLFCKATFSRGDGSMAGLVGVIVDITDQKESDRALRAYQEQLQRLTAELALSEEKQRRQIAAELHDNLSQNLAFARIKLDLLRQSCPQATSSSHLKDVGELVTATIDGIRALTWQLSPPLLHEVGFEPAVRQLAEMFQDKYKTPIYVTMPEGVPLPLSHEARITLFQVLRELLVNVVKHAGASRVDVRVWKENGKVKIAVRDDGCGFVPEAINNRNCFGLFNVRQKISCLGGTVTTETAQGKGTRISVGVPL